MSVPYNETVNFSAIRGDTFETGFSLDNQDDPAYDYTGTTLLFQVKADSEDTVSLVQATPTPNIPGAGQIEFDIEIPAAEMATIPPGKYVYDVQFTLPDGKVRTHISGVFIVLADVSR